MTMSQDNKDDLETEAGFYPEIGVFLDRYNIPHDVNLRCIIARWARIYANEEPNPDHTPTNQL